MKKILLCTDGSAFAENIYRYGAWFANRLEAEIDILCVTDIRGQQAVQTTNFSGAIGIDTSENLLARLVELEHEKAKIERQRAKLVLQAATQNLESAGVGRVNPIHTTGFLVDCLSEFEVNCDLIVLGKRGAGAEFASGHLGANLERIVRSSHKPCLVTPRQFKPIKRILLAYDGGKSCQKVIKYLSKSQVFQDLEFHIVTVNHKNLEQAHQYLDEAKTHLKNAGFTPITQLISGIPEEVISEYIAKQAIDFLIMGAYGHNRLRNLIIGSTTAQILRNSHIPVLLFK